MKKYIESEVAQKTGKLIQNGTNLRELPKLVAEIATVAITKYNSEEKMREEAKKRVAQMRFL